MGKVNFWTEDSDGERWLINGPELVIASNRPKKGKAKMYTNRKRKKPGRAHMAWVRSFQKKNRKHRGHTKRAKTNMYSAGQIANRPRRRTRTVTRTVTRYKRNPLSAGGMLGSLGIPAIEPIAGAFAGLAVPPMLNYFLGSYVPTSITSNPIGKYAVKAGLVVVPSFIVRKYVNRNVGNIMMIVGIGKLLLDAVHEFVPSIPWLGLSGGMGYQPMLGAYTTFARTRQPAMRMIPMMTSSMTAGVPDRLNPQFRH
jgi:hypothetical protein